MGLWRTDAQIAKQIANAQAMNAQTPQAYHGLAQAYHALAQADPFAQQAMQQAMQASTSMPSEREKLVELSSRAREQFVARMGGVRSTFFVQDTDCVYTHINGDKVILFYCFSGKVGHVEEPIDMFPSDTLIAQFRMILA